ncbi:MAG: cyanophycinase [Acidobacteriota bacterium]|nr:MAG: cyanophycinase [Acidobacteriota bacterium]
MKKHLAAAFVAVLLLSAAAVAQQRLLVIGGGKRPPDAMKKFVEWSGGERSNILVITWASEVPEENFEGLKRDLTAGGAANVIHAAMRPLDAERRAAFLDQISKATGVFFSGGDQNRIMDVLADGELLKIIRERYNKGVPFGGTSAGAAAMSDPMMTGDADLKILDGKQVGVRKGLGLIPNVIFDQHFLVRQRHNRLFGLIEVNPNYLGIGIDEDTAVLIEDNRNLTVAGPTQVMFVDAKKVKHGMAVYFLKAGERFDLAKRKLN